MQPRAIFRLTLQCHSTFGSNIGSFILQYKLLRHWPSNALFQLLAKISQKLYRHLRKQIIHGLFILYHHGKAQIKGLGDLAQADWKNVYFYGELQR